ncbi:Bacterial Transmembrane Pair family protein [Devosia equisanguinis]|uniref:Bacterial Transmembrane Pair family protein n=1 Tax=Devosia equisanguinis TaxID=2490941 RepID=A0A447IBG7_9HYPH|nr:PACE efflux transporter [Devosia equisanguinis]VDS04890.1 Bacterial Transmembrane Pair family protein [Devosia equisanguinis]
MRTTADRIRHAISFEVIGIILATPLAAFAFHLPGENSAVIVVASATVAMIWNYVYNLGFDHLMVRVRRTTEKTTPIRVAHAVFFELGLLAIMLPAIAWYLQISIWQALVMDIALAVFYMAYAFVFNWAYDRVFPLPEWQENA